MESPGIPNPTLSFPPPPQPLGELKLEINNPVSFPVIRWQSIKLCTQVFPGNLLEHTYSDPDNCGSLLGRSEVERRRVYFEQMEDKLPGGSKHPLFQLIKNCLMNDPSKRPSVQQVLTTLEEMKPMITVTYNQGATAAAAVVGVSGVKLEHPVVNLEHLEVHRENHAPPSSTISPMYSILQKSLSMVDPSDDLRLNVQVTEPLPPELIPTIKQSYWKEVAKASVCANQSCKKLLTETDRPHNCNVCGEVFCHSCYRYCQNPRAETYPLFYSVCLKCNSHANTRGMSRARLHEFTRIRGCLLYTSPSPRDATLSRMPSSA